MKRAFACVLAALLGAVAGAGGCEGNGPLELRTSSPNDGGGAAYVDAGEAGPDAPVPDAPPDAPDAGPSPVLVAVTANPAAADAGAPSASDELDALLTTFAAGVRAVVVSQPWRDLTASALLDLAARAKVYESHGKSVLFNVALVDRAADGRPDELAGLSWDDPEAEASLDATLDAVIATLGPSLRYVTFGRDVDVYLSRNPSERQAFSALATHACDHVFAKGLPGLSAGVAFSYGGATKPDPSFDALLGAGDVAVLSFLPGLAAAEDPLPASGIAGALDAMVVAAGGKPIVLQAIGATSSEDVGGSLEKQQLFYDTFFDALAPRRGPFALVDAFELHDLDDAACAVAAGAQSEPANGAYAQFSCALGLFAVGGAAKPAWHSVVNGAATFASP